MRNELTNIRSTITESMGDLIKRTERIYDSLAHIYPQLMKEMQKSTKDAHAQILELQSGFCSSEKTVGSNLSIAKHIKEILDSAKIEYQGIHSQDNHIFHILSEDIKNVTKLEKLIKQIRENSEAMELISLNAMTVAIKAGKAGGAFSYITEELKRISARTITNTETLTQQGKEINYYFEEFQQAAQKTRELRNSVFSTIETKLSQSFKEFSIGIDEAISFLQSIVSRSKKIEAPLMELMEEIQHQDIIRQSIDHVVLALEELQSLEHSSKEELLDELAFIQSLPDLCTNLLDDVKTQINKNAVIFKDKISTMESIIDSVEKDLSNFLHGQEPPCRAALFKHFSESEDMLNSIVNELKHSFKLKEHVNIKSNALMGLVESMDSNFISFAELVSQFHNVNVASKIEVAKQEVLKSMKNTVLEMNDLTTQIETTVDKALVTTRYFIKNTKSTLYQYQALFEKEDSYTTDFDFRIKNSYKSLNNAREDMEKTVQNFSVFTGKFVDLFQKSSEDLKELISLGPQIDESLKTLQSVKETAEAEMNGLLSEIGKENWEIKNERLQKIIERFTILKHKMEAGKIGGFLVEEGVEQGEVTFF